MTDPTPFYEPPVTDGELLSSSVYESASENAPLWRAFPLCLGSVLAGFGCFYSVGLGFALLLMLVFDDGSDPGRVRSALLLAALVLPVLGCATALGLGVARGRRWARTPAAAIGVFVAATQGLAANLGHDPQWLGAAIGLACLTLVSPRFDAWFDLESRAQLHRPQNRPSAAGIAWLTSWIVLAQGTLRFKDVFDSIGLELPLTTTLTIWFSVVVHEYWVVVIPALLGLPLSLLWLTAERVPTATRMVHAAGAAGVVLMLVGCFEPLFRLLYALQQ